MLARWGSESLEGERRRGSVDNTKHSGGDTALTYEELKGEDQVTAAHKFDDLIDNLSHPVTCDVCVCPSTVDKKYFRSNTKKASRESRFVKWLFPQLLLCDVMGEIFESASQH